VQKDVKLKGDGGKGMEEEKDGEGPVAVGRRGVGGGVGNEGRDIGR